MIEPAVFSHIKVAIRVRNLDEARVYYHDQAKIRMEEIMGFSLSAPDQESVGIAGE